ncbi:MAG: hypothetical protein E4H36_07115, partial [Spirochaetales bacterium]
MKHNKFVRAICISLFFSFVPLFASYAETEPLTVSVSAGYYGSDQHVYLSTDAEESEIYYSFVQPKNLEPIKYVVPFTLSALPGETRTYTVHAELRNSGETVFQKDYIYTIDKEKPAVPQPSFHEGTYAEDLSISFPSVKNQEILYSLNSPVSDSSPRWADSPVKIPLLSQPDGISEYTLWAYAKDAAGNTSPLGKWVYKSAQKKEDAVPAVVDILSPAQGTFANPQMLAVTGSGLSWIRYSIASGGAASAETEYTGPVEIPASGDVTVTVTGKSLSDGSLITKEISYKNLAVPDAAVKAKNGIYSEPVTVSAVTEFPLIYCFDDRTPLPFDGRYKEPVVIKPLNEGLRYVTLRFAVQKDGIISSGEYRYFFILDDRTPPPPSINLKKNLPLAAPAEITISGSPFFPIYYTLDGTTPDKTAKEYREPFVLDVPKNAEGFITVRAKAISDTGKESEQVTNLISFDTKPPEAPGVIINKNPEGSSAAISISGEPGASVYYTVSYTESPPQQPGIASSVGKNNMSLSIPFGMDTSVRIKACLQDSAGNLSEASESESVILSNRPQPPPEIEYFSGIVRIKGEGTVYYSLSDTGQTPAVPDAGSEVYQHPLFLSGKKNQITRYVIRAVSVNEYGTRSSVSGTYAFTIDLREPVLPQMRGLADGGIFNSVNPELKFDNILSDLSILYTYTKDGSIPKDPDIESPSAAQSIKFASAEGEEIYYQVKLMPAFLNEKKFGPVTSLTFIIDRRPPVMPALRGFEQNGYLNRSVTVTAVKGAESDNVYLSLSYNEKTPPDPAGPEGMVYTRPLLVDVPDKTESMIRIRIVARDRAGNLTYNPTEYGFVLDRLPPPEPELVSINETAVSNEPILIDFTISRDVSIYYELAKDMKIPAIPTAKSTKFTEPFYLTGEEGKETTYHLSAIAQDRAGNISSNPPHYTYTIDRKPPEIPSPPQVIAVMEKGDAGKGSMSYTIAWSLSQETSIFYSLNESGDFRKYASPFEITLTPAQKDSLIRYFAEDKAGNRSTVQFHVAPAPQVMPEKLLAAISDKGVYNKPLVIKSETPYGIIRYELGTQRTPPGKVTKFSPVLKETLSIDSLPGETVTFILNMKQYRDGNDEEGFKEERRTFTIDRTPPAPPIVTGITDGAFYQEDRTVRLSSEEGFIYYS